MADSIPLGQWTPRRIVSAVLALVFAAGAVVVHLRWSTAYFDVLAQIDFFAVCWVGYEVYLFLHRDDRLRFDTEGFELVRLGRHRAAAWKDVDTFWLDWTTQETGFRLTAGAQRFRIPLGPFSVDVAAAQRFRACLEPLWQRKLQTLAVDDVRPVATVTERRAAGAMGAMGMLVLGVAAAGQVEAEEIWPLVLVGVVATAAGVALWLVPKVAAGPDELRIWGRRVPLSGVESIEVRRTTQGESWILRGDRVKAILPPCVDFPVVGEHILRRCPEATITAQTRRLRTDLEQVFLPLPANPPAALSESVAAAVRDRLDTRKRLGLELLGRAVLFGACALGAGWMHGMMARPMAEYRERGLPAEGTLYRRGDRWLARYEVSGHDYTAGIFLSDREMARLREGERFPLRYLPEKPHAAVEEARLRNLVPDWLPPLFWGLAGVMLLAGLGVWFGMRERSGPSRAGSEL